MSCGDLLIEEMSSEVVNLDEMYHTGPVS
jgi:hypothetical protein